jgi:hypothetical protein
MQTFAGQSDLVASVGSDAIGDGKCAPVAARQCAHQTRAHETLVCGEKQLRPRSSTSTPSTISGSCASRNRRAVILGMALGATVLTGCERYPPAEDVASCAADRFGTQHGVQCDGTASLNVLGKEIHDYLPKGGQSGSCDGRLLSRHGTGNDAGGDFLRKSRRNRGRSGCNQVLRPTTLTERRLARALPRAGCRLDRFSVRRDRRDSQIRRFVIQAACWRGGQHAWPNRIRTT